MEKEIKSGLIIEPILGQDWTFGSSKVGQAQPIRVTDGNWVPYLPSNEKQRRGYETMCCTNFSSTSAIEILFTWMIKNGKISVGNLSWLNDNGYIDDNGFVNFSDRFDALISKTSPQYGNSLKAPAEAKKDFGLIPERMMPWVGDINEYFDKSKITPEMYAMGKDFKNRFPINYEFVYEKDFEEGLKTSPLAGGVYAWNGTINGVYKRVDNQINHAIAIIDPPHIWKIFDSYDPFIKKLANDFNFLYYAIRYIIRENTDVPDASIKKNMYLLRRDPKNPNEVYAFNESLSVKRHVVNEDTLIEGAKNQDQYWVWDAETPSNTPIPAASQEEFNNAVEMAEILLLPKDRSVKITTTGGFNLFRWFIGLFKK